MRKTFKTLLVILVLSSLAACNLPSAVPTMIPTLPRSLPLPTAALPSPLPTAVLTLTPTSPFAAWLT